ncbi:hypothetical protein QBA54_43480 [Streptomyces sp. B21-108]|uniref:hypothetical protein n=1 Tax=Streptomyces sp. B21-108 TaxID=3039419 RepID=UPI002FF27B8C
MTVAELARTGFHGGDRPACGGLAAVRPPLFRDKREAARADRQRLRLLLREPVRLPLGADVNGTTAFLAYGMLVNSRAEMGFPSEHRVLEGLYPPARPPS